MPIPFFGGQRRKVKPLVRITRAFLLLQGHGHEREQLPPGLRFRVLKRDGYRCRYCGKSVAKHAVSLEVDHVKPVSRGGTNELSNLVSACSNCNRGKGAGERDGICDLKGCAAPRAFTHVNSDAFSIGDKPKVGEEVYLCRVHLLEIRRKAMTALLSDKKLLKALRKDGHSYIAVPQFCRPVVGAPFVSLDGKT